MSMGLDNGKKPVAQLGSCHDLHTADGESMLKRTAIANVEYSTRTRIRLDCSHYIKGSHPLLKHIY